MFATRSGFVTTPLGLLRLGRGEAKYFLLILSLFFHIWANGYLIIKISKQCMESYQFPSTYTIISGLFDDVDNSKRQNFELGHSCSKQANWSEVGNCQGCDFYPHQDHTGHRQARPAALCTWVSILLAIKQRLGRGMHNRQENNCYPQRCQIARRTAVNCSTLMKFESCYYGQVNHLRLKSSIA